MTDPTRLFVFGDATLTALTAASPAGTRHYRINPAQRGPGLAPVSADLLVVPAGPDLPDQAGSMTGPGRTIWAAAPSAASSAGDGPRPG